MSRGQKIQKLSSCDIILHCVERFAKQSIMRNSNALFLLISSVIFTPTAAQAQDLLKLVSNSSPSVEIYGFDEPAQPVQYVPAAPRPEPMTYNTATISENISETDNEDMSAPIMQTGPQWSGRVNFGASLQTGNTEQDAINADTEVKAKWLNTAGKTRHRATLKAEYNRETEDDTTTEDNRAVEAMYDYFFRPKWFLNTNIRAEQDDISEIDLRLNAGAGLGYQMFERDDLNLQFVLGPTYLREEFEDGSDDSSIAARWTTDYDQKVLEERFQLFHSHELLVPADDTEGFLFDSKTGIRMPIIKGITGTAEVDFDWDNDPEPGITEDDTTYALKLGYEW